MDQIKVILSLIFHKGMNIFEFIFDCLSFYSLLITFGFLFLFFSICEQIYLIYNKNIHLLLSFIQVIGMNFYGKPHFLNQTEMFIM